MKKIQRLGKKCGIALGIMILAGLYIGYNHLFMRIHATNKIIDTVINPLPYVAFFDTKQDQQFSFFTLPAFPTYNERCHTHKKFCQIVPLQKLYADTQWMGSIQFVASAGAKEMAGLAKMLDNVTNLDPYWFYPYAFGQLLIPQSKRGGAIGAAEQKKSRIEAVGLAEKGINFMCDPEKVHHIKDLPEEQFIKDILDPAQKERYKDPCPGHELPYWGGFNAFYYLNEPDIAADMYKIASFQTVTPGISPLMAAMVYGRGGQHAKSATIWYDRAVQLMQQFPNAGPEDQIYKDKEKSIKKAVFEAQLHIISQAEKKASTAHENKAQLPSGCEKSMKCLTQQGYIQQSLTDLQTECGKISDTSSLQMVGLCGSRQRGVKNKRIMQPDILIYPDNSTSQFGWSEDYNSRWIE